MPEPEVLEEELRAALAAEVAALPAEPPVRPVTGAAVRVGVREADHLAEDIYDEPAALLYALARQDRAPSRLLDRVAARLALAHARRLGFRLDLSVDALAPLAADARAGRADYEAVRAAVATHLDPYGG